MDPMQPKEKHPAWKHFVTVLCDGNENLARENIDFAAGWTDLWFGFRRGWDACVLDCKATTSSISGDEDEQDEL